MVTNFSGKIYIDYDKFIEINCSNNSDKMIRHKNNDMDDLIVGKCYEV